MKKLLITFMSLLLLTSTAFAAKNKKGWHMVHKKNKKQYYVVLDSIKEEKEGWSFKYLENVDEYEFNMTAIKTCKKTENTFSYKLQNVVCNSNTDKNTKPLELSDINWRVTLQNADEYIVCQKTMQLLKREAADKR